MDGKDGLKAPPASVDGTVGGASGVLEGLPVTWAARDLGGPHRAAGYRDSTGPGSSWRQCLSQPDLRLLGGLE